MPTPRTTGGLVLSVAEMIYSQEGRGRKKRVTGLKSSQNVPVALYGVWDAELTPILNKLPEKIYSTQPASQRRGISPLSLHTESSFIPGVNLFNR